MSAITSCTAVFHVSTRGLARPTGTQSATTCYTEKLNILLGTEGVVLGAGDDLIL